MWKKRNRIAFIHIMNWVGKNIFRCFSCKNWNEICILAENTNFMWLNIRYKTRTLCCLFSFSSLFQLSAQPGLSGGEFLFTKSECISDIQAETIKFSLNKSLRNLEAQGVLPELSLQNQVLFDWPTRLSGLSNDPSYFGISNYVDHNSAVINKLKDYNCGTRTYDLASGYNHRGLDIYSWPFGQLRQAQGIVEVVAAADGVILGKDDGNSDQNCGLCTNCDWNAVYVLHSNGAVSWYGHLKNGSLTTKAVGAPVTQGEFLGIMASSGSSTGPHLHFEVWSDVNFTKLVDPFAGPCNDLNGTTSWWNNQRPYRRPALNKIMSGSRPPVFPTCPQQEVSNEKNVFAFGDSVCVTNFYQDQLNGSRSVMQLIRPDGVIWQTWSFNSNNLYGSSYWFWNPWFLPNIEGYWKYKVVYQTSGQELTHTFYSGNNPPVYTKKPGNWNDASVWSTGVVPGSNVDLFVCHPVTLNQNLTVKSLMVNEGGRVLVENGISLTVTDIRLEKANVRVVD